MNMKTMRDNQGHDVPLKYVSKYDRVRDARVRRVHARAKKLRAAIEAYVRESLADVEAVLAAREGPRGEKGNIALSSFDGLVRVSIDQSWRIELDERVRQARDRMLNYAKSLCAKAGDDAKALFEIVEEAFAATRSGGLSVGRVLSLCRRNIAAPEWLAAKQMLLDSIKPERGKAYLRVETRASTQHDFRQLRLDVSDCWPVEGEVTK